MITLMVIAVDRYFVITRPLASIGVLSKKRAQLILMAAWVYSLGWSLPPFFGWSAYVPEGLLTSCSWDYVTFTPSVRAYTMLLFTFVFFIPLIVIMYCYFFIFRAIRTTNRAVTKINCNGSTRDSIKSFRRLKNEWKMAKIALIVILLYVISWSPYSVVALTAFAGDSRQQHSMAATHNNTAYLPAFSSCLLHVCRFSDPIHELSSCCDRQGFSHSQPHHLCHHPPQVQVPQSCCHKD
ncbi:unnamed protein product [Oncorhynchus mykiss]|uniref:G-protein coupled receptors family 1 profile domain-containing protein n=1 Tax=Oncorhynchus mykiss TaxID=8022 RepID=A0A060W5H6_ONCMY|nr:unnamed protein product [Oncorhynchus mykiss]